MSKSFIDLTEREHFDAEVFDVFVKLWHITSSMYISNDPKARIKIAKFREWLNDRFLTVKTY